MIVDIHAHVVPPKLLTRLREGAARYGVELERSGGRERLIVASSPLRPFDAYLSSVSERIETMDRQGVDVQAISAWQELYCYELPTEDGVNFSRALNETIAELAGEHPTRFVGMANVPLQDGEVAARVLEEAVRDLKLPAAQIGTHFRGRNLDDPSLEPLWSVAEELGAMLLLHPLQTQNAAPERLRKYWFINVIGNPLETTIAAGSLICGGVLERHPRLKVCLAHGGGFLAYQLGRLRQTWAIRPEPGENLAEDPERSFQRLFFDAILYDQRTLQYLLEKVGSDHLLLGSDYPFDTADDNPVGSVNELVGLSDEARQRIMGDNARELLHMGQG